MNVEGGRHLWASTYEDLVEGGRVVVAGKNVVTDDERS